MILLKHLTVIKQSIITKLAMLHKQCDPNQKLGLSENVTDSLKNLFVPMLDIFYIFYVKYWMNCKYVLFHG